MSQERKMKKMKKYEFLDRLRSQLGSLSAEERERSVSFYAEMIDDMQEEGKTEEEAVEELGAVEDIAAKILSENGSRPQQSDAVGTEMPTEPDFVVTAAPKPKYNTAAIILIIVIAVMFGGGIIGIYIGLWGALIGLYAAAGSIGVIGLVGMIAAPFVHHAAAPMLMQIGLGLMGVGICFPLFMLANLFAKGLVELVKLCIRFIKHIVTGGNI